MQLSSKETKSRKFRVPLRQMCARRSTRTRKATNGRLRATRASTGRPAKYPKWSRSTIGPTTAPRRATPRSSDTAPARNPVTRR
ncbi:MAG TPA: hypothetical protein VLX56_07810, partial [Nitrososphaerales archaeon]|nr:hypothetical protein [Nitrososphaerales archaeon]